MRAMKDSGVEWIGEIPQDWEVVRLKSCFSTRDGGAWGEDPTGDNDVICLRIADFDYNRLTFKDCEISELTKRHYTEKQIHNLVLKKDDLLIEKSGGGEKVPVGRVVIFNKEYRSLYANFMDRLRCRKFVYPKYMLYILTTFYQNGFVWNYIKQTTGIQNLDLTSMLLKERIVVPSRMEQSKVISYLDSKCSKIDAIIAKQQALIEKLKEYKLSAITEAVTKGLKSNIEMKDSGVEWIGEVPKHWGVVKLKYATNIMRGKFNHRPRNDPRYYDGKYPFVQTGDVARANKFINSYSQSLNELGYSVSKEFPKGSICMTIAANIGDVAVLNFDACFPDSVVGFVATDKVYWEFLYNVLKSMKSQFMRNAIISTQMNLNIEIVKEEFIPIAPFEEQKEVVLFLNKKCDAIDTAINKKQNLIEKLISYKKSLIYEVVTGKKKV